jgi:hypothetical protein
MGANGSAVEIEETPQPVRGGVPVWCRTCCAAALALLVIAAAPARGQEPEPAGAAQAEDLAKQLSNPVANLVSVPFQFNWEQAVGHEDATRFVLNIQPVVPFSWSEEWNLIGRWIMPVVSQPSLAPGLDSSFGLSDIVFSSFFSPKEPKRAVWGVGPVFALPTTTDPTLGSGKWQAGPTAVVLKQSGPWTYGFLVNHLWSFADASDDERADVNRSFVQPFLAFGTPNGVTYNLASETTYDWEAASGEEWTAPVLVTVSKITRFGPFPFSVGASAGYYLDAPSIGPDWKLRTVFTLILPAKK